MDVNARAVEALGHARGELVGATHRLFASLSEGRIAKLAATVLVGEPVEFEDEHRRKDGTSFPVEVRMKRVRVGGEWVVLSTARDLTRRRAEAARREADEQRAAILRALPTHVALLDAAGTITAVNEAWRRFAAANGLTGDTFGVGANYLDVCDRVDGECSAEAATVAAGLREVLAGAARKFRLEYPYHAPSEERWDDRRR